MKFKMRSSKINQQIGHVRLAKKVLERETDALDILNKERRKLLRARDAEASARQQPGNVYDMMENLFRNIVALNTLPKSCPPIRGRRRRKKLDNLLKRTDYKVRREARLSWEEEKGR